jgi:hypothetical protein
VTGDGDTGNGGHAVRGLVSAGGAIGAGTGFALTRTGVGSYTIGFLEPFAEPPVVLVQPSEPGSVASAVTSEVGADVVLRNLTGVPADVGFGFVAEPVSQ